MANHNIQVVLVDSEADPVRASMLHYETPFKSRNAAPDEPGKYTVKGLIMPGGENERKCNEAINTILKDYFEVERSQFDASKLFLRDGNHQMKKYPEYEGLWTVSASSSEKFKPNVVDSTKVSFTHPDPTNPILPNQEQKPYSGCYCNLIVNIWEQDNSYGQRVNASFEVLQFTRHGERFGGKGTTDLSVLPDVEPAAAPSDAVQPATTGKSLL